MSVMIAILIGLPFFTYAIVDPCECPTNNDCRAQYCYPCTLDIDVGTCCQNGPNCGQCVFDETTSSGVACNVTVPSTPPPTPQPTPPPGELFCTRCNCIYGNGNCVSECRTSTSNRCCLTSHLRLCGTCKRILGLWTCYPN